MCKIFISHSTKDEIIVQKFIDTILVGALGFNLNSDIFCTSVDGGKISASKKWRDEIKDALFSSSISILIITPNYRESEVCMNEMGAIWACCKHIFPLIVEPIAFTDFSALLCEVQGESLTDEKGLDRVKDQIAHIFELHGLKSDNWTRQKQDLLSAIRIYLKQHPFLPTLSRTTFDDMTKELNEAKDAYDSLYEDKQKLESQYNQLKKLKDKEAVLELEHKYSDKSEYDAFDDLVNTVRTATKGIHGVILTLIYNDYAKKGLNIDWQLYSSELSQAAARGLLTSDNIIQSNNQQMKHIHDALMALENFLKNVSIETYELIEKDHPGLDIDIKNLDFWEKVLWLKLCYE